MFIDCTVFITFSHFDISSLTITSSNYQNKNPKWRLGSQW